MFLHPTCKEVVLLRKRGFRKWFLIGWACVLAFGIGMEFREAQALDRGCWRICARECRAGGSSCYTFGGSACDCEFDCSDGSSGSSVCT